MRIYHFIFLVLFVTFGCNQPNNKEEDKENNLLSSFNIKPDTKAVLIVPLDGCRGCVKKSLEFIKENQANSFVEYILSASNKKDIAIYLKSASIGSTKRIIKDPTNKATSLGLTKGYPTICYLNSNPIVIKQLSASNLLDELIILSSNINHWNSITEICEFDALDIKPSFVGGMSEFYSFLSNNVVYPQKAKIDKIEGKAIIELIIDAEGAMQKVNILKDFYNCCGEEFQQAILQSPKWIPGKKNGKEVSCRMILPVSFKLE